MKDNQEASKITSKLLAFFLRRSVDEIQRRFCYFIISFGSCFLTIFIALIANTVISQTPLIFLSVSEVTQGEIDMIFRPSMNFNPKVYELDDLSLQNLRRYFNMTRIDSLTPPEVGLLAPRLHFSGADAIKDDKKLSLTLLVLDSYREKLQRIGSKYDPPILKQGECAIHKSLAEHLGLEKGSKFELHIPLNSYLQMVHSFYTKDSLEYLKVELITTCTVGSIFSDLGGKLPSDEDENYLWMELKHFTRYLATAIEDKGFKEFLEAFNPYDLVQSMLSNHPNREAVYLNEDFRAIQENMAEYSGKIISSLGFYPLSTTMPILRILFPLNIGAIFLNIILDLIVILLAFISTFLIYSLLTISVESRTFEFGTIRMLGITKTGLASLVLIQAMLFVLPAFLFAFIMVFPGLSYLSNLLHSKLGFSFSSVPTTSSFIWALCIGLLVPALASILPIYQVIKRNLVESLDMQRSKSQGVHITIEFAQEHSSFTMFAFGSVAIIYGLSIYYFLPLTLLSMNLQLMLWIMLSLLLAIIIGLILLSLNITHLIERLLVHIFLFYESNVMKFLVIKNMIAHKFRNRRTIIIYSLSLGFLLFAVVAYTMELRNVQLYMLAYRGSKMEVRMNKCIDNFSIIADLEDALLTTYANEVEDFGWNSLHFAHDKGLGIKSNWISDFGRKYYFPVNLHGISPNYFEVTNEIFTDIYASNKTSGLSMGEQLYTTYGSQGMGVGSFFIKELNLDVNNPKNTYQLIFDRSNTDLAFETRPIFSLNSCPGLRMTRREKRRQAALISLPLYMKFSNITSISMMHWQSLVIKMRRENMDDYTKVYEGLRQKAIKYDWKFYVWSYSRRANHANEVKDFLDIIFGIIITLFMSLSFFSLSSSMTTNILEQSKELAIVRSVGITRKRVVFLHIYEAFILVLTGSFIGAGIGMLIGYTLSLQRVLFTDLPIQFVFPYRHFVVIIVVSVLCAILSTASPSIYLLRKPIAELSRF